MIRSGTPESKITRVRGPSRVVNLPGRYESEFQMGSRSSRCPLGPKFSPGVSMSDVRVGTSRSDVHVGESESVVHIM